MLSVAYPLFGPGVQAVLHDSASSHRSSLDQRAISQCRKCDVSSTHGLQERVVVKLPILALLPYEIHTAKRRE